MKFEETKLDKIKNWFSDNFSTSYRFNPDNELTILSAFSDALRRWLSERDALWSTKCDFGRSSSLIRKNIDKLLDIYDKAWFDHISDVFASSEDMFSENFISLMEQSKNAEVKIDKIISNPISENEKWEKIEGYVELTRSVNHLLWELKRKISKPVFWFLGMFSAVLIILLLLVPFLLEWFSKIRDISQDSYFYIWEITIAVSRFASSYGLYILIALFVGLGAIAFFYTKNDAFKEALHKYIMRMYIVWDIIELVYTKKVVSLMAIYNESKMSWEKIFTVVVPLVPLIPMKKELEYLWTKVGSYDFDTIFKSYSEDERYFTEMFYLQLAKESNSSAKITGRYKSAFANILSNTDRLWNQSIRHYPDKIGRFITVIGFLLIWFFTTGIMVIFLLTILNSV